jgi:type II secretory pathway pseudopilin PulG
MKRFTLLALIASTLLLPACAQLFISKRAVAQTADQQTTPIIAALEQFRQRTGHYPATLKELEQSPEAVGLYIPHGTRPGDKGWIDYWTTSPAAYVLVFSTAHSQVGYENGVRKNVSVNPYR